MTEMISKWFFASFRTLPFVFLYGKQEPRSWGGVQTPPPPAGGGKSRGPAGRGLILLKKSIRVITFNCAHNCRQFQEVLFLKHASRYYFDSSINLNSVPLFTNAPHHTLTHTWSTHGESDWVIDRYWLASLLAVRTDTPARHLLSLTELCSALTWNPISMETLCFITARWIFRYIFWHFFLPSTVTEQWTWCRIRD